MMVPKTEAEGKCKCPEQLKVLSVYIREHLHAYKSIHPLWSVGEAQLKELPARTPFICTFTGIRLYMGEIVETAATTPVKVCASCDIGCTRPDLINTIPCLF